MSEIIIGSRGSPLALCQARLVKQSLQAAHPDIRTRIEVIRTSGDRLVHGRPGGAQQSIKGLFVKEIEEALLEHRVDLAVHSLKDLPAELPEGLCLGAVPEREDPRDALLTTAGLSSLEDLAPGARVGTSSLRRQVQLRALRPDLEVVPVRGNIDTRIRKMKARRLDAIVLAAAGLNRLGLAEQIAQFFTLDELLPAAGQGALGLEIREEDAAIQARVEACNHPESLWCARAERRFLHRIGGGCRLPLGAHAQIEGEKGHFRAFIASPSRGSMVRATRQAKAGELEKLALEAAEHLLADGGAEILEELNLEQQP